MQKIKVPQERVNFKISPGKINSEPRPAEFWIPPGEAMPPPLWAGAPASHQPHGESIFPSVSVEFPSLQLVPFACWPWAVHLCLILLVIKTLSGAWISSLACVIPWSCLQREGTGTERKARSLGGRLCPGGDIWERHNLASSQGDVKKVSLCIPKRNAGCDSSC